MKKEEAINKLIEASNDAFDNDVEHLIILIKNENEVWRRYKFLNYENVLQSLATVLEEDMSLRLYIRSTLTFLDELNRRKSQKSER